MFRLSLALLALLGLGLVAVGVLYLTTNEFMPYHAAAVQAGWADLDRNFQGLLLGLLKGLGAGALIAGAAIIVMAATIPRRSARPYYLLLPLVATGYPSLLAYATYVVAANTPGDPPLTLLMVGVAAGALGSVLLLVSRKTTCTAGSGS